MEHVTHWSWLEDFRKSPRRYHALYVTKTLGRPEDTRAQIFGSAVHLAVLEPEKAGQEIAIAPKVDRRTKKGKDAWEEFQASAEGKLILTPDEMVTLDAMVHAVHDSEIASALLTAPGESEVGIAWTHTPTGLRIESKIDRTTERVLVDLKTTGRGVDPRSFARAATDYGYHRQAALYLTGWENVHGDDLAFAFIVVSKDPPYEVAVYELDGDALDLGRHQNEKALARLRAHLDENDWRAPYERGAKILELPPWAHTEDVWEVAS